MSLSTIYDWDECEYRYHTYTVKLSNGLEIALKKENIFNDIALTKVKLVTFVEGDPKAPFSIATTPRCRGGCYTFP